MKHKPEDPRFRHVRVPLTVFPGVLKEMTAPYFLVYVALRKFAKWARASEDFGRAYPGEKRIAELTGYSVRQVIRIIQALEVIGAIATRKRKGRVTEYVFPDEPERFRIERRVSPKGARADVVEKILQVRSYQRSQLAKRAARKRWLPYPKEPVYSTPNRLLPVTPVSPVEESAPLTPMSPRPDTDVTTPVTPTSPTPDTDVTRTCSSRTCAVEPEEGRTQAPPQGGVSSLSLSLPKGNTNGNGHSLPEEKGQPEPQQPQPKLSPAEESYERAFPDKLPNTDAEVRRRNAWLIAFERDTGMVS